MRQQEWYARDLKTAHDILIACVGLNFGSNPEERIDDIRKDRYGTGKTICRLLSVAADDVVADIGSGCGFVTRTACEIAKEVHCIDISEDFLSFARDELAAFPNARFHCIDYGAFPIPSAHLDKAYSTAVFIHFYYYDFLYYLIEINRVLRNGGLFYVEILDSDVLKIDNMAAIKNHVINYRANRQNARLIQPFSLMAFRNLFGQLGFSETWLGRVSNVAQVIIRKDHDAEVPSWLKSVVD